MDVYEATRVVLGRMQSLDAENAAKIMGYILIQEHGDKEMIRLAFGPEAALLSAVLKARKELGLAALPPFGLLAPQNSSGSSPLAVSYPTSFAPPLLFTRSGSGNSALNGSLDELQGSDELVCPSPSPFFNSGAAGGELLVDEFRLRNQLSCLKEPATGHNPEHSLPIGPRPAGGGGGTDLFHPEVGCRRPRSSEDGLPFPYRIGWGVDGDHYSWSWSAADVPLRSDATTAAGFGWKQCLYFARGYCKDGTACRFLHGQPNETAAVAAASVRMDAAMEQQYQDLLLRSNGVGTSQLMASTFPKCQDFLFQQQQNDSQRAAATASLMRLRMEGMLNPGSRQIYLTFPADSTFTEEDVSNYFSIYGPVQDVRIPYQQKRMFGFVTFVYSETVKLILAKGNPHFVCDARVLVKPYKKKGKVPDKCRKQQQQNEREDFSSCTTPTGLESRDHYDLQQLGARMLYNNNISQEQLLLRRKLEEQRQVLELQLAIELQTRRFVNLQLKPKNYSLSSSAPAFINSPTISATAAITVPTANTRSNGGINQEHSPTGEAEDQKVNSSNGFLNQKAVNSADKEESSDEADPNKDSDFHESTEHNLPNSPFASPTKLTVALNPSSVTETEVAASNAAIDDNNNTSDNHPNASTLLTPTSTLDMASYKSCFFQMPRFSSNHGAIGM